MFVNTSFGGREDAELREKHSERCVTVGVGLGERLREGGEIQRGATGE